MSDELDVLLARVDDPALRADLRHQIDSLRAKQEFGLVFEDHLPERVRLPEHPVRRGVMVVERGDSDNDRARKVIKVSSGEATLAGKDGTTDIASVKDVVAVAEFGEPIYPGLKHLGTIRRGGDKPAHVVLKGENHHALELLQFTHAGKVDCIYIDPPYNSGARDWKYDNNYVDKDDGYRHSLWLAFMQRRLVLAKQLLNPENSVLIVTIDEKEYLRLGLLLQKVFAGHRQQMVSITINPKGTGRPNEFSRVDEFAFFVYLGDAAVPATDSNGEAAEIRWRYLRRNDLESVRGTRPRQFYPVYVDRDSGKIAHVGNPLKHDKGLDSIPNVDGATPVFPIREDGLQMEWGLTGPSLQRAADSGYVRVTPGQHANQAYTISYLTAPNIRKVETGGLVVTGTRDDGSKIVVIPGGKSSRPTTVWREKAHDAGAHGTSLPVS